MSIIYVSRFTEIMAHCRKSHFGLLPAALLFELLDLLLGIWSAAGRRSALGMNVIIQVALAIALVGGINAWSFRHYKRYDLTRDRVFTIDPNVASELKKLSGET